MDVKVFIKSGAILSSIGVIMLVLISVVLLAYPIINDCHDHNCTLASSAPNPLNTLVKPNLLAISISVIAVGVALIRFGIWYEFRSKQNVKGN